MDMSDIINIGTQMFQNKVGEQTDGLDSNVITDALSNLLTNENGEFDLGSLVSNAMNMDGLGSIVSSWLGDGDNDSIDFGSLASLLGEDKISEFSEKLGIDTDTALDGLSEAIPNIVDKSSEGGNLIGSLISSAFDNSGGIMGLAGKLFGR